MTVSFRLPYVVTVYLFTRLRSTRMTILGYHKIPHKCSMKLLKGSSVTNKRWSVRVWSAILIFRFMELLRTTQNQQHWWYWKQTLFNKLSKLFPLPLISAPPWKEKLMQRFSRGSGTEDHCWTHRKSQVSWHSRTHRMEKTFQGSYHSLLPSGLKLLSYPAPNPGKDGKTPTNYHGLEIRKLGRIERLM